MLVDFVFYAGLVAVFFAFVALFYRITSFLFVVFMGEYVVLRHVQPNGELVTKRVRVTSEQQLIDAISEMKGIGRGEPSK